MSGFPPFPGIGLGGTTFLNFGEELDRIDRNVASILANQTAFYARIENQLTLAVAALNQQATAVTTTVASMAQLLEGALMGLRSLATLANQTEIINLLNEIQQDVTMTQPRSIGIDPSITATAHQEQPPKSGP